LIRAPGGKLGRKKTFAGKLNFSFSYGPPLGWAPLGAQKTGLRGRLGVVLKARKKNLRMPGDFLHFISSKVAEKDAWGLAFMGTGARGGGWARGAGQGTIGPDRGHGARQDDGAPGAGKRPSISDVPPRPSPVEETKKKKNGITRWGTPPKRTRKI